MITTVLFILAILWLIGAKFWDMLKIFLLFILSMTVIWGAWLVFLYFFTFEPIINMVVS